MGGRSAFVYSPEYLGYKLSDEHPLNPIRLALTESLIDACGLLDGPDVFRAEPGSATGDIRDPLLALPNIYGTHHIGGSTDQAQEAIAAETVRVVTAYMTTGRVPNVVNLAVKTPATHRLIVRHRDRPGVLAHVFEVLKTGRVNVQETENVIFEGAEAAIARISIDAPPSDSLIAAIRNGNKDILDLHVVTI